MRFLSRPYLKAAEHDLGTGGTSDDRISRLKGYSLGTQPILEYGHIGLSMFAMVDLVAPGSWRPAAVGAGRAAPDRLHIFLEGE